VATQDVDGKNRASESRCLSRAPTRLPLRSNPRSGNYFVWGDGEVRAQPSAEHTLPLARNISGLLEVDLSSVRLANPPKLETARN
jgi:hypothetical protein